ncbi:MAG: PQQ-binding-like beta-propeller repeat protein [archaeon]
MNLNKSKFCTISLVLVLAISATLTALPTIVSAHDPALEITTFAFINVAPNPVGVNQQVNVLFWLDKVIYNAAADNEIRFHDYTLTITKPDGDTEVVTYDVCWDTTSSQYYSYVPTQVGTYTFHFDYPGQTYTWSGDYENDVYLASSATTTLTVQEEPINPIAATPLPDEYWTRPIYGENSYWFSISSNWLGTGSPLIGILNNKYVAGAVGSKTSHIMWTRPLQSGGVVGATPSTSVAGNTYFEGTAYLRRYTNPIIVAGKLYYTEPLSYAGTTAGPTICLDLETGEVVWSRTDVPTLSFAYIYDYQDMNYHGVWQPILIAVTGGYDYFSGTVTPAVWQGFDADTGNWLFNITNVPSGSAAMGPHGEYLMYVIQNAGTPEEPDYYLCQWNMSKTGSGGAMMSTGEIAGVVDGGTSSCYDWNVSIPWLNTMDSMPTVITAYHDDLMLCYNGTLPGGGAMSSAMSAGIFEPYTYFAVNLDSSKGDVGSVLWWNTLDPAEGNVAVVAAGVDAESRVFVEEYRQTAQWVGYDLDTGDKIWGPTESQLSVAAFDYYGNQFSGDMLGQLAYGRLYSCGFSGIMFCYDISTGDLLWTYGNGGEGNSTSCGYELAYGHHPTNIYAIGDEVIYTLVYEHTVNTPIYKGAKARAIDAITGEELWTLSNYGSSDSYAIADGYSNFMNGHDNQIYVVGKGPSKTAVSIPNNVVKLGSSVLVTGTVIDISAGTEQEEQAARFPNGVPAVSDESMDVWMQYVYQQDERPSDVTGVTVKFEAVDPNSNYQYLGTTTTDFYGNYGFAFEPEVEGTYMIIATFEGSDGYYASTATTYVQVDPTASVSTPIDNEPVDTETPVDSEEPTTSFLTTEVAIIATIAVAAIIGIAAYILLKRK